MNKVNGLDLLKASQSPIMEKLTYEEYNALNGLRCTELKRFAQSPYKYKYGSQKKTTKSLDLGRAVHAAILEPEIFEDEYILAPKISDKRLKEYKELAKKHEDKIILTGSDADKVRGIQDSIAKIPHIQNLISINGMREASVAVKSKKYDVDLKARFDILGNDGTIIDLKTATNASLVDFSRAIVNYQYHLQAAFYSHVYHEAMNRSMDKFIFIAVETEPPYECAAYNLSYVSLHEGEVQVAKLLNQYSDCIKRNNWPRMQEAIQEIEIPNWAFSDSDI